MSEYKEYSVSWGCVVRARNSTEAAFVASRLQTMEGANLMQNSVFHVSVFNNPIEIESVDLMEIMNQSDDIL